MRPRPWGGLPALTLLAGCAVAPAAKAPATLPPGSVWAVRVTPLPPDPGEVASVVDPGEVRAIAASEAFAAHGWAATGGAPLSPRYRIDLLGDDGARASFWLGTGAQPPRFPCYAFCTGWWIAPAGPTREIDATAYKGLPESVTRPLLEALDIR
jgi:hypothetical protein